MSELRAELAAVICEYVDDCGHAEEALRAADAILDRYAVLPLPEGKVMRGSRRKRWELPHDGGDVSAFPDGVVEEGTSGYWNVARGDDVLGFVAALVAAHRYAMGERITESIWRGGQDVKDGNLTDLDDIAGEAK